ncbi:E3 ubiquitin-protein ligase COP1-like isoform X1 [Lytechinus variegatus]|uniref:E3 ubiquitin-protein ligase COP1-like isoform X1 n=2 Tax=Lytechinus variegatus TaxID=7654 RepID=UPI001BB1DB40|nr:E3 ubiquitin-protein ligase COP1-like isoform X1 [Lytechinus variegatus]
MANNSAAGSRQTTRVAVRGRKRTHVTQVYNYNGVHNSYEDKDNDFLCPICFEVIEEAHMTRCGHSFCRRCILRSLETSNRCPKCNFVIEKTDQIFPNFALNELILKYRQRVEEKRLKLGPQTGGPTPDVQEFIQDQEKWDLAEVNLMLEVLVSKKRKLEMDNQVAQIQILKDFLDEARRKKLEQINELSAQMSILEDDIKRIEERMKKQRHAYNAMMSAFPLKAVNSNDIFLPSTSHSETSSKVEGVKPDGPQEGFNGSKNGGRQQWLDSTLASRRKKLYNHFDDLQSCYFSIRQSELTPCELRSSEMLDQFSENLSKFTKFSSMRPLATLSYADPYNGQSSIVSSIEFDKDNDFFAIAGVTKKIKVFEYGTVIMDAVDIHYPVHEMACSSKISCVAWSAYHKGVLASSDYEGTVTLWDAFAGVKTQSFQEHEKRCWSIDFNRMDPKLLASGSDDAKVKLWSTNQEQSITSLEAKANVCCVKFNPTKMYGLAFGSADHCVHYYDLRHPKQPLNVFKGHRKAVSYTKFVNSEEIVSASTDSQLKLWNVDKPHCLRTFRGHINEKNFVGLTSNDDYIACGSENNSLFVFYKGLSKQILTFKFDTVRSLMDKDKKEDDSNEFVSAVAWRTGSNVLVAANSQGTIKVLELV